MFLVDENWQPKPCALEVLERLNDPQFTTELALFNLEANLRPVEFGDRSLRGMEEQLNTLVAKARSAATSVGARVVCTGILPTISTSDLTLDNLTPRIQLIPGSAQSDRPANFTAVENFEGSRILRWDLRQPLEPGAKGTIQFRARVL